MKGTIVGCVNHFFSKKYNGYVICIAALLFICFGYLGKLHYSSCTFERIKTIPSLSSTYNFHIPSYQQSIAHTTPSQTPATRETSANSLQKHALQNLFKNKSILSPVSKATPKKTSTSEKNNRMFPRKLMQPLQELQYSCYAKRLSKAIFNACEYYVYHLKEEGTITLELELDKTGTVIACHYYTNQTCDSSARDMYKSVKSISLPPIPEHIPCESIIATFSCIANKHGVQTQFSMRG